MERSADDREKQKVSNATLVVLVLCGKIGKCLHVAFLLLTFFAPHAGGFKIGKNKVFFCSSKRRENFS